MNAPDVRFTLHELAVPPLRSLAFWGDHLIDWLGGHRVGLDGRIERFGLGHTFRFDSAIGFEDLGLLYELLGTKGNLVHWNGQLASEQWVPLGVEWLREIDRSFYHAEDYSFPACLFRLPDGRVALAHCPRAYDRLDLELLDGKLLTPRESKNEDFFHSRLEASPDGRWLLSNGWVWQPWNDVCLYDVQRALAEPGHLGTAGMKWDRDGWEWEIDAATFVGDRLVIAASTEAFALGVLELPSGRMLQLHRLAESPGSRLMAWGPDHVVAFDGHPRLLSLATGAPVHRWDALDGGPGLWQPRVNLKPPEAPWLARDPARRRFALAAPVPGARVAEHEPIPWRVVVVAAD